MRSLSVKRDVRMRILIVALLASLFVFFLPLRVFASGGDGKEGGEAVETTTEVSTSEEATDKTTEDTDSGKDGNETSETTSESTSDTIGTGSEREGEKTFIDDFGEVPKPVLDSGIAKFFDTMGGKILGVLLKILSVGMVLTVVADLVFIAVPFTRGIALSMERSGFYIVSNEAHQAAGVPREQPMNRQGHGRGGMAGGYGGMGGGYGGGYGGMGGGYGAGGMGMNGQQGQDPQDPGGIKQYIKSAGWRMILITAFAVFILSGAYLHVGYALGNGFSNMLKKI